MEELKEQLERLKKETKEKSIKIAQRDSTFDTNSNSNCSATVKNCSVTATSTKNNYSTSISKNNNCSNKITAGGAAAAVAATSSSTTTSKSRRRISINHKYYTILNNIGKGGSSIVSFQFFLSYCFYVFFNLNLIILTYFLYPLLKSFFF